MLLPSWKAKIRIMSQLSINTTQNVVINFTAASVGERIGAYMLDLLVKAAYFIIVYYVFFSFFQIDRWLNQLDNWSQAAVYMVFFLPIAFYSLVQEALLEGETLGKNLVKIKV